MNKPLDREEYFNQLIGQTLNDAYRIDEKLGQGGMGAVYRASRIVEDGMAAIVAIKVISPEYAGDRVFKKRFQREARVGEVLSHQNIIKVYEFGEAADGMLYMVMEFVEGETLAKYMKHKVPMAAKRCLQIIQPLCDALGTAHDRNILHRDLKPANIIIGKENDVEMIKLADFGIVKLLRPDTEITENSNLTALGEVFGTPLYMSPEQLMGLQVRPASDIYSLGVIVHEMLTGKLPIECDDIKDLMVHKMTKGMMQPPSRRFPFLPTAYDSVLMKALETDPEERYQHVSEFYRDLVLAVEKHPQSATMLPRSGEHHVLLSAPTLIMGQNSTQPGSNITNSVNSATAAQSSSTNPTQSVRSPETNVGDSPETVDIADISTKPGMMPPALGLLRPASAPPPSAGNAMPGEARSASSPFTAVIAGCALVVLVFIAWLLFFR